eukprot:2322604-Karenia_brevis.AAC.1
MVPALTWCREQLSIPPDVASSLHLLLSKIEAEQSHGPSAAASHAPPAMFMSPCVVTSGIDSLTDMGESCNGGVTNAMVTPPLHDSP